MSLPAPSCRKVIDWDWAGSALELESGDLHVVVAFPGGALIALLDGLGHGAHAAVGARAAVSVLEANPDDSLLVLVQRCHEALRKTRGAVMSIASFDAAESSLTWLGVGNVEGVLVCADAGSTHAHEAILSRGGVVGYQLPTLRASTLSIRPGDTLIMATDGVRAGFVAAAEASMTPRELAQAILARFAKGSDDTHVVVARFPCVAREREA